MLELNWFLQVAARFLEVAKRFQPCVRALIEVAIFSSLSVMFEDENANSRELQVGLKGPTSLFQLERRFPTLKALTSQVLPARKLPHHGHGRAGAGIRKRDMW